MTDPMFTDQAIKVTQAAFKMGYDFARNDNEQEIKHLKSIIAELLQHAEYMLSETERAMDKDVTLLQKRIRRARNALKDREMGQ